MASSIPKVSSSLSSAELISQWKHDVFLSFSDEGTRFSFASHVMVELQNRGIAFYHNDSLLIRGASISVSVLEAMQESRFAIVVLSQNYASSDRCLNELVSILKCMEGEDRILPLFYNVNPFDVQNQTGSFAEVFANHENENEDENEDENEKGKVKVIQWRAALTRVASLSGLDSNKYESERKFVEHIVEFLCGKVRPFEATTEALERTSEPAVRWTHDVFLSFRGEDTRRGFLSHLYDALQNTKVIRTFKDDNELVKGTSISPSLLMAIEESMLAIIVISPNYASSTWCLDELAKIFQCMEGRDTILPIFYYVNPSDVRHQRESFEVSLTTHEKSGQDIEKVKQWRLLLKKVANLSGWDSKNYENDSELVKHIVELVCSKVKKEVMARSSEPAPRWKHDVFLSFRREDTGQSFISHLYHELEERRGIKTFKDNQQLEKRMAISPNVLMAIEESRFAIIVLSKNYASSTWCLDELIKIFECMEGKDTVLPIFYHVDPSEVQHELALTKHKKSGQDREKVKKWRVALEKVANLSGWHTKNYKYETELIKHIVDEVRPISIMSTIDFEPFEATRQAMEEVMKALKDDEITIVGVYGMAGVGKTTMVKHVGAQAQKNGIFDHVIMVVVSQISDLIRIQGTLADLLGMRLEERTQVERAKRLNDRIMRGRNKILIILDDIWEKLELSSIGFPSCYSERQRCKSKVLLTTRIFSVCNSMESEAKITLNTLSEEDSWKLFVKKSGRTFEESTSVYNVARKVVRECAGLPNALKAVSRALSDKDLDEWNEAALRLRASQTDVFKSIKLSYHSLTDDDAKSCFFLCCLFPEGDDIQITDLMKYGFGKGLFRGADTIENARHQAHLVVEYLKSCSLLLYGAEEGCVRMHNVIRDVAMSIALSEDGHELLVKSGSELKEWPMDAHQGYSAISLMKSNIHNLPEKLVCPKLQILLLQSNDGICEIPDTFFQSLNELKVLDLSGTSISLLTPSFSLLMNLQALYLDCCKCIIDISILGKMKKLEILSMRELPLKELPKEIGHLTNLRILDITNGCVNRVPSKVISGLERLEELYMQYSFRNWGSRVEGAGVGLSWPNNASYDELTGLPRLNIMKVCISDADFDELTGLPRLNILKVCISDAKCLPEIVGLHPNWVKFDICINRQGSERASTIEHAFPHHHSRVLTLDTASITLPNWFINVVTKKAEALKYLDCKALNNILVEYDHGSLDGLKYLAIIGPHENLQELMNATALVFTRPVFESLEELHLYELDCLKELCVGELPPGSLCKLKLLKVDGCHNLVNALLPSHLLPGLQNLKELICSHMDGMEHVFGFEWLQPKQSKRDIRKAPAPQAISNNLKILAVTGCAKLKMLFTFNVAQCFSQLEDLWIDRCDSLHRVIEASEETVNNTIVFLKLKNLVLMDLPQLIWFFTRSATIECPSLEHLHVEDCPQFLTPASDFHSRKKVQLNDVQHWWSLKKRLWKDAE